MWNAPKKKKICESSSDSRHQLSDGRHTLGMFSLFPLVPLTRTVPTTSLENAPFHAHQCPLPHRPKHRQFRTSHILAIIREVCRILLGFVLLLQAFWCVPQGYLLRFVRKIDRAKNDIFRLFVKFDGQCDSSPAPCCCCGIRPENVNIPPRSTAWKPLYIA